LIVPSVTMLELAEGVYDTRKAMGVKTWADEKRWFMRHAKQLHHFSPKNITATDVETCLLAAKAKGIQSLDAINTEVDRVLRAAKKQRLVTEVVTDDVELPRNETRKRKRVQLRDVEFTQYLLHPDTLDFSVAENGRRVARGEIPFISREVKTLSIVARCIGGARASDLHALTWEMVDVEGWKMIAIYRPKVGHRSDDEADATDVYEIPEDVIPYLQQWWADHGRPDSGPVFPACLAGHWRDGARKYGGAKKRKSYAPSFRRDLLTAGVTRHELHNDTPKTRATDFHSLRRALVSAMRRNQIPTRIAMAIVHHKSQKVHNDYDTLEKDVMVMPAAALPALPRPRLLTAGPVQASQPVAEQNPNETKSSQINGSSGELIQMSEHKSICANPPAPPESLRGTGTYGVAEPGISVEAPGIEPGSALLFEVSPVIEKPVVGPGTTHGDSRRAFALVDHRGAGPRGDAR
ncbi:MAG TPA: hypothetical protein VGC79_10965, partial [Polyangiaceae bacterium]